jgi:transposase
MPRFRPVDAQPCFIPVVLADQLLPGTFAGTFEYALNHLIESGAVPLSAFDAHYANDEAGAPAVSPAVLLKVVLSKDVLSGYSRGLVSSRAIASACEHHVLFMALCGLQPPHFTTVARFVARCADLVAEVFQRVLLVCDAQGLIGREMFAIDGVKLPSNASKRHSGASHEDEAGSPRHAGAASRGRWGAAARAGRPCRAPDRATEPRGAAHRRLFGGPPRGPRRQPGRLAQEQRDRQRVGQDGH